MTRLTHKIICGDCLEAMKEIPDKSIDIVLTDPPYGIGADLSAHKAGGSHGWKQYGYTNWDKKPKREYFVELLRVSKNQIIWGGNYFTDYLYPSMGWLVWNKGQRNFSLADGELAWTSFNKALRIYDISRTAALKDSKEHPTQKSLLLFEKCILNNSQKNNFVLDSFLGSGTTMVAAERLGRNSIGIEISKEYCELSYKRLLSEISQGRFDKEPSIIERIGF